MIELVLCHQIAVRLGEQVERHQTWEIARAYADSTMRPLLNVGCGASQWLPSDCGDVCLDLDPGRLAKCRAGRQVNADVRTIPYPDRTFGAAIVCHVLEHMPTVADGQRALAEIQRVADRVWVVSPGRDYAGNWLTPDHYLWVDQFADGTIVFEQRHRRENTILTAIWAAKDDAERRVG